MRYLVFSALLASPALAQTASADPASPLMSVLPLIAIFFVFFFLLIRPQMKQAKQRQAMLDTLKKGDVVVTGGGAVGKITRLMDDLAYVELASGLEIKVLKSTIVGLYNAVKATPNKVQDDAEKKNPAVKNDNIGLSRNKVANDN